MNVAHQNSCHGNGDKEWRGLRYVGKWVEQWKINHQAQESRVFKLYQDWKLMTGQRQYKCEKQTQCEILILRKYLQNKKSRVSSKDQTHEQ